MPELTRRRDPHRTGLTLAAFVLGLALALFFNIQAKADDRIPQLRKIYEDCVFRAVGSQAAANPKARFDPSAATELAFQACQPEERAIVANLYAAGVTAVTAEKALRGFKLRIQKTVRELFGKSITPISFSDN